MHCRLGERRRLSVAIAMISEPRVLLLDEPTLGLEPDDALQMWRVLHEYAHRTQSKRAPALGRHFTVVVALSRFEEAASFCDRIGILVSGQLCWSGFPDDFTEKYGGAYEIILKVCSSSDS